MNTTPIEDWFSENGADAGAVAPPRGADDGQIGQGRRNAHLTSLAGSMRAPRMMAEAIAVALVEENARRCDPPLSENEVRTIAASIGRYTPNSAARDTAGSILDPDALDDITSVAAEGRVIAEQGVPYVVDGIIPARGMAGVAVAYAKVGKSTFSHQAGAAVATGVAFLGRRHEEAECW